ncbi:hypothetical protein PROFUN_16825 [Planoprotostelium fungivorum]|uniref:DNA-directed DNA polymerase n=1 Tax=Planoprotostelium fungivorum TaxID=1890364 RepID=A0A2P6MMZ5_9EUKA|nr:hypothetical protein PROFUN_16825 [Planoprotostelium fungivorum]
MKEYLSIPILGFNSGKYDLTFIITHMQKYDISPPITKTNSYMKLEYGAYAFLDAHNYVPPTTNLEKFGIMWGVKDIQKELSPYEWFDSLDKLSETSLPPIECFYNKLRNTLPTETEYQHAVKKYDISPPITKTNSYMKLEYGAYAFLDAHNYVPPTTNLEKFGIMWGVKDIQKELFPYEWFDSLDKLSETSLPPIECFYNKLRNTLPSETEYQYAGTSNYRTLLMTKNNMELLNYVSVAQISYQNILKNYLKHDLRTIPGQKMYNLISDSIYGGRCEVFKRHAVESDGVIMGLDENNLYGWAMMQKLPYGSMKQVKNVSKQQQQLPYNQRYMYGVIHKLGQLQDPYQFTGFVRCSLYYTQEQRELTKNFPPLAEKIQLDESVQVSGYMDYLKTQLKTKHNKITLQTEKLMYNLFPKDNYCIYSETLKYLLENNLCCINDIYEVIEQPIDYVLKDYVQDMTANRQKAEDGIYQGKQTSDDKLITKSSSEKEFFKLMVNSGFGKMLQSDDKYNKSLLRVQNM